MSVKERETMSKFSECQLSRGDRNIVDISELQSVLEAETRYDFFALNNIVEHALGFDTRGCENKLSELGFDIPRSRWNKRVDGEYGLDYCDYWHYQLDSVFRTDVRNDSCNTIYVGTPSGIDCKKLKKQPNDWQKMILEKWNELLSPLANEHGWIKVVIWW